MLDLNIDAVSVDSACDETDPHLKNVHTFLADDSGASSSVVNADAPPSTAITAIIADEESNSSSRIHTTLKFSILNSRDNHVIQIVDDDYQGLMTRQLFPVPKTESFSSTTTTMMARPQHWLKLSVPEAAKGGMEIGIYDKGQQQQLVAQPQQQQQVKKSRRGPRSRSSQYRGVTFYRRTGRWESHIWDCGKQVYLGGFDTADAAARAYDRASIQFRGVDADINFHISDYDEAMKQTKNLNKEEFVQILRRQSTGLARGSSKYRGVTLQKSGRLEARMGQFLGKNAYDKAVIKCNGREASTNSVPRAYGGEISRAAKDRGRGDNLDLNLWISPTSYGLIKEKDDSKNLCFHYAASGLPDGKRLKVESSFTAPDGITMASQDSSVWARTYSGVGPNNEERAKKMRAEGIPLSGLSNWPWKMHCHGGITSVPLFSSAASSGFSTNTAYSTTILSSQNKIVNSSTFQTPSNDP